MSMPMGTRVDDMLIGVVKKAPDPTGSNKAILRSVLMKCAKVGIISLLILTAWILIRIANGNDESPIVHSSCADTQPLVSVHHNFLPPDDFRALSKSLPTHPLISKNNLSEESFNSTEGWVLKFNGESVQNVRSNPLFQLAVPYIDRVLVPEANAFVFNLLVCKESSNEIAVKPHFDNTVGLKAKFGPRSDTYLAHQVNVLYTSVPVGVKGGDLEVWAIGTDRAPENGKVVVKPAENLMVTFRGDAVHQVRGFKSPGKDQRISLVLEQYKLPDNLYHQTVPYCENEECDTA